MQSWDLDPKKGDYVMTNGAPNETNSLRVPAYFRLKIKRTTWMYAPNAQYGSDFYTLKKLPPNNTGQIIENVAAQALQPLADDGRAKQIEVAAQEISRNGASLSATILDASGREETVTFPGLGV